MRGAVVDGSCERASLLQVRGKPARLGGFSSYSRRQNERIQLLNPVILTVSMRGLASESPPPQPPLHQRRFGMILEDRFDCGVERHLLHRVAEQVADHANVIGVRKL